MHLKFKNLNLWLIASSGYLFVRMAWRVIWTFNLNFHRGNRRFVTIYIVCRQKENSPQITILHFHTVTPDSNTPYMIYCLIYLISQKGMILVGDLKSKPYGTLEGIYFLMVSMLPGLLPILYLTPSMISRKIFSLAGLQSKICEIALL